MAIGRPTVCIYDPVFFEYIDYGEQIPIVNANPDTIYEVLKTLLSHRESWVEISSKSRLFVEDIHDLHKNAEKLIAVYEGVI
jgi:hypothetical protein